MNALFYSPIIKFILKTGLFIFVYPAIADRGDTLLISGDIVNLRAKPSMTSVIYKRLAKNNEVIEISRYQEWVEVTTNSKNLDYGWIHQSLLNTATGQPISTANNKKFEIFRTHFVLLLKNYEENMGKLPFSGVELIDKGTLQVTATDYWFALEPEQRNTVLTEVFDLWRKYVDTGISVMVEIVDDIGGQHMMMFK